MRWQTRRALLRRTHGAVAIAAGWCLVACGVAVVGVSPVGPVAAAATIEVSGTHEKPEQEFGVGADYRLAGDTTFGWQTGELGGDIDLDGHALTIQTGNGNRTVLRGAISGNGSLTWSGGGVPQVAPSILAGDKANTCAGTLTLVKGVLDLAKPAGTAAITGDLVIGTEGSAVVRLANADQIADSARVSLAGKGVSGLELQGHGETIATLAVLTHAVIDLGGESGALTVGDCSAVPWEPAATLTVVGHVPGRTSLRFGRDGRGLAPAQLARIGFADPAGLPPGLYTATLTTDGTLQPERRVDAVNPPFDVSPAAVAERARLYEVPGLERLSGPGSPLADGVVVSFFGDSLTWLNGYVTLIEKALAAGKANGARTVKLVNRGINGGGVLALRDGSETGGFPGNGGQKPFRELIAADDADLAVVFIGINDVWWRETTPEVFEQGLRDLAAAARDRGTRLVVATMTVRGELPDGKNPDDAKIDHYCEITRRVAVDTGATLVDLRAAYVACLRNRNAVLRVDGSLFSKPSGVLTYDGVHPTTEGNRLLADLIADGIVRELQAKPRPR